MYQDYRRNQEQQGELRNWFEYSKEKDWMQLLYNPLRQKLNIGKYFKAKESNASRIWKHCS